MSKELTITVKAKLDEKGKENLQKKLKSYNLGKDFNYAIAVLKLNIANCESDAKEPLVIRVIPKVQYITPFVSKELAEKYMNELSNVDKLMMFLKVGEDGRVILKENEVDKPDNLLGKLPINDVLNVIASDWESINEENKDKLSDDLAGKKDKALVNSLMNNYKNTRRNI